MWFSSKGAALLEYFRVAWTDCVYAWTWRRTLDVSMRCTERSMTQRATGALIQASEKLSCLVIRLQMRAKTESEGRGWLWRSLVLSPLGYIARQSHDQGRWRLIRDEDLSDMRRHIFSPIHLSSHRLRQSTMPGIASGKLEAGAAFFG